MKLLLRLAVFMVAWLALASNPAWAQTAINKAAPIIPKSFGATALKALEATPATANSGALLRFRILSLPTSGTLSIGATPAAVNSAVSIADQGNLRYDPDANAPAGNYSFTYRAEFAAGVTNTASFSLPVSNASCSQNSAIDFSERTVGENWQAQAGVTVSNTTVSTSGYTSSVPAGQTNILEISNQPARLSTQGLVWQLNNQNVSADNRATVNLNFSRPVRNLAFSMEDIDVSTLANGGSDFVDEVTFNAYALGSNTPYQLVAGDIALGSNNSNTFVAGTNTIKGTGVNSGPAGTVVLTYPAGIAVSRLEIIYRNTQTYIAGNGRLQTIGIPSMVWCAEVDLATTLTGPAYAQASSTVAYTATTRNQGDIDAAGVSSTVQLIPGLLGVTINGTAATLAQYNPVSGLLTLPAIGTLAPNASSTGIIRFTMPLTGTVTGRAQSTTTGLDVEPANNNGSLANAQVTTVQNQPPVANDVTVTPSIPVNSGQTAIAPLTATDPNGNLTVTSYRITSALPPASQGTFYVNGVVLNTTNFPNLVLNPTQVTQLTFDPSGTYVGTVTFQYTATDDFNVSDITPASYTLTVSNQPPVAFNVTNSPAIPNSFGPTPIASLAGADSDGTISSYTLVSLPTAAQGVLLLNGSPVTVGQQISAAQAAQLQFDPVGGFTGNATFTYTATDNNGAVSQAAATYTIPVAATTTISGTIFEDVNYGGGAGRSYSTANQSATGSGFANNAIGRSGATVELYDNATGQLVSGITPTATSGANGAYTFTGVPSGSYTVRAVNSTVTSVRNTSNVTGLLPVQTFVNGNVNRVGGENPNSQDAAANTGTQTLAALTTGTLTPQSITTVTVASTPAPVTTVDFGFNFSTVTNTNDAGAGSLRQFISNSNALPNTNLDQADTFQPAPAGQEFANFMLNDGTTTGNGLRAGVSAATGYSATTGFTITLASALPVITDASTSLDGDRIITGQKVAAAAGATTGPEVSINFNGFAGLETTAANTRLLALGLAGARGTSTAATGSDASQGAAITLSGAATSGSVVNAVTASGNATAGVRLEGGATGVSVTNSILRNGSSTAAVSGSIAATDGFGIVLEGAINNTITGNTISNNAGNGIALGTTATVTNTGNLFEGNTVSSNGAGAATDYSAGIRIRSGQNNLFLANTITNNDSDGILANSGTTGNRFSQNAISGHTNNSATEGDLGIDLANGVGLTGNGTDPNDNGDADSGANGTLNFPVLTQAARTENSLVVRGYAPAGALVEVFVADVTGAGFGEGRTYLTARTEGQAGEDADGGVGSYTGLINGVDQGAETNAWRFFFVIPLSSLSAAQLNALDVANIRLTATATVLSTTLVNGVPVGNTSEFSGNIAVVTGPLPVELKAFEAAASNANAVLTWSTASEQNNDHFVVERSFDGGRFERIGQVRGQGTTSQTTTYRFTDAHVGAQRTGVVYYRLQQVDTDGTASYSPVRTVQFAPGITAGTPAIGVYPNPATSQDLTVTLVLTTLPAGSYEVRVLDATGRVVCAQSAQGGQEQQLPVQQLPAGVYLVQVQGQGLNLTQRFSKQ